MPYRRRIKWTLFATQSFGSAALLVSSTVTPIVGSALSGRSGWAGVPAAFYWGGGAAFAFLWGRLMDGIGRRLTMVIGLVIGLIGALIAAAAVVFGSFPELVIGLILMGGANTVTQLARFVAAEVHPALERGRAISTVVLGGTVGGVLGPLMVGPASRVSEWLGRPGLAGPYAMSACFLGVGAVVVGALLFPEPRDVARTLAATTTASTGVAEPPRRPLAEILRDPAVIRAMFSMLLAQGVMSMLMVISSLHMKQHDHPLSNISLVMSSHMVGMYGFSLVTGRLADSWGRGRLIAAGAVIILAAGLGATVAVSAVPMGAVLLSLGLGWNLCYVGGSTLLTDRLTQTERARVQGINDACLTSASAIGSLFSGIAFARVGYGAMGFIAAALALFPFFMGWTLPTTEPRTPAAAPAILPE